MMARAHNITYSGDSPFTRNALREARMSAYDSAATSYSTAYTIRFAIKNGVQYIVFRSGFELADFEKNFPNFFKDCPIVSFGQFENAFELRGVP